MPIIRSYAETYIAQYRNILGANRIVQFHKGPSIYSDIDSADEVRKELIRTCGHDIDEEAAPLRIEYFNADGIHTDTWTCDNAFDGCLYHTYMKGAV
jgi:hypothetical protein